MNSKYKVLCDLSWCHTDVGFAGIPQDARMLFIIWSESKHIDLTGYIFGANQDSFDFKSKFTETRKQEELVIFLGSYLKGLGVRSELSLVGKTFAKVFPRLNHLLYKYKVNSRRNFKLHDIPEEFYMSVWRQFFSTAVPAKYRAQLADCKYAYSHMSVSRMVYASNGLLRLPSLDTKGYDFAVFQDARSIKLSPDTIPIMRYHDGIPFFASDTVADARQGLTQVRAIKDCENKTFVCSSTLSLNDLSLINEKAAENAVVIPCLVPEMKKPKVEYRVIKNILVTRASPLTRSRRQEVHVAKWFNNDYKIPKFIMTLSTIEPRKNTVGLINAWLKLRRDTGDDIKLLIAGRPGWGFEKILEEMRPHIKQGNLMHLEAIAQHEVPYLYAAASCFVFPSYMEGFGLPPNEAMQCDCPVAVSDIPAHRYSCGDAALYFDPYNINETAHVIAQLLDRKKNAKMIDDLIAKGRKNVERYSHSTVLPQWEDLFDKLKKEKKEKN